MTEREFTKAVIEFARSRGWLVAHFEAARAIRDGRFMTPQRGDKGFPDLTMQRASRLVFAELKTARGHINPEQAIWLSRLVNVPGVEAHVWRPADWPDEVAEVLA